MTGTLTIGFLFNHEGAHQVAHALPIAAAITERTRAIFVVHYGGVAVDLDRLTELAAEQRSGTTLTDGTIVAGGQTQAQIDARSRLDEALSVLGTDVALLTEGLSRDHLPGELEVLTADEFLRERDKRR